ncbi:MAG: ABC transporter permease subunit, partial [Candidatus Binatia bacterium]
MDHARGASALWSRLDLRAKRGVFAAGAFLVWLIVDRATVRGLPAGIVILGMVFGSLYALTAVGLVLIFRANRVMNFAQAELGGIGAVVAIQLVIQFRWNYFGSVFLGLLCSTILGGLVYLFVIRRFRNAPRLILAVATIGIAQILQGASILISLIFQGQPAGRRFETPF